MRITTKILIIEDDFGVRESMQEVLEDEGYEVLLAHHGQDGLQKLRTVPGIDLVLLDLTMPIMTGQEFLAEVGKDPLLTKTRIVVISAVADHNSARGAVEFVTKPLGIDLLLSIVEKHSKVRE